MDFTSRLESRIRDIDSLLCVGLDPHPDDLALFTGAEAHAFCLRLIRATVDFAAAFKPNIAFFEALGSEGIGVLQKVIAAIPEGIPVILDAKRGDISSTAQAYTQAAFEVLGADAITINPYLGFDAVEPFITDPDRGVFLLCKTSNPGAADLQELLVAAGNGPQRLEDRQKTPDLYLHFPIPLYIHIANLACTWNTNHNLGLVVGATQPASLVAVRAVAPDLWILAPGVGAQGGDLTAALQAGLRADGLGMLIPVSRGISRANDPQKTAMGLRDLINQQRELARKPRASDTIPDTGVFRSWLGYKPTSILELKWSIADGLLEAGCIKFGTFTLKSGIESPIYIDLRRLVGYPGLLSQVALSYIQILLDLHFDHLAALPYAALPIASAISLQTGWSMVYPRKEAKSYGTMAQIEGVFQAGQVAVVIDDLITTGGSKFEGIEKLTAAGLVVKDVVVLIDRSLDGASELEKHGHQLHHVLALPAMLDYYEQTGKVAVELINATRSFLKITG
jgi:uridine monophosphate synthetase